MTTSTERSPAALHAGRRVPDFFIVGHPKCGTTALHEMLKRHPQIFMPEPKEPRFLASDLRDRFTIPATETIPRTLEEYLNLFERARPEQRAGEASPTYLSSRTAAAMIAELQPKARIIALLREPASFLHSLHLQFIQTHVETERNLRKALALEQPRREGKRIPARSHRPQVLLYSEHVRYVEQLRRFHELFPADQVLVLIYDDFRNDNEATVRKVLRFLDVDEDAPIGLRDANPTIRVRARLLHGIAHTISVSEDPGSRALRRVIGALAPKRLDRTTAIAIRDRLFFAGARPPDERVMQELRRRFKPEVVAASEYLGRDLVRLWGYDELD
jgi:sulfotransferase family protein